MRNVFVVLASCLGLGLLCAQTEELDFQLYPAGVEPPVYQVRNSEGGPVSQARVEPPFWWVGMAHPTVEVVLYDEKIRDFTPTVQYPGVHIAEVTRLDNPNYLFVTLAIGPGAQPGSFPIVLADTSGAERKRYPYALRSRTRTEQHVQGIGPADLIYLLMPDRFANGDRGNDSVEGMQQTGIDRNKVFFRHGGDLLGVIERLDYLDDLGVTALWLNPVLENDEPYASYHGYAVTDHYRIDRRFGDNDVYCRLVQLAHERGMKVVMDVIFNHVGDQHWFIRDLPSPDWIHQEWPELTKSNFRAPTLMDPYAAAADVKVMQQGWFDNHMPDLNQQHPQLANYLIQNTIWWMEFSGQDALRVDTYSYPDQQFMDEWARRLQLEFPRISIFGEVWDHGPGIQSWFGGHNPLRTGPNSRLDGLTDFQLQYAILEALQRDAGWTEGVARLYYTLAQDYLYRSPYDNVTFLDNHDVARFYSTVGQDFQKFKAGIALLLTLRGTPSLYYGTEILMTGSGGAFGEGGRRDFPGGWREDRQNHFVEKGRSPQAQEAFQYVRTLARYRRATPALHDGHTTQFVPENGVYVYFRHNPQQTVMVVYNSTNQIVNLPTARFAERMLGFTRATNVLTGAKLTTLDALTIPAKEVLVLELAP